MTMSDWTAWLEATTAVAPETDWTAWLEATTAASPETEWWVASDGSWRPAKLRTLTS